MLPLLGWVSCAMCAGIGAWVCRRGERVWRSGWDLSTARNGLGSVLPSKLVYAAGVVSLTIVLDNAVHRVVHVVLCQLRSTFT